MAGISLFLRQLWGRWRLLRSMRSDDGRYYGPKTIGIRLKNTLVYAFGQTKFFRGEQPAGVMHVVIFWGFVVLLIQVLTMFGRGWVDEFRVPGFGMGALGGPYGFLKDIFEVAVALAVTIALYRWGISRPSRLMGFLPAEKKLRGQSHWEAFLILVFILGIMLSGLLYDAGRFTFLQDPDTVVEREWQPISLLLSMIFLNSPDLARSVSEMSLWIHNLIILCFVNFLPRSKHFHIITAIPNIFLGKIEPNGKLPKRDFTIKNPIFGRSQPQHFTWKQALDMFSCTECGRCSSVCPATATGKPLAPRQFLVDVRDSAYTNQAKIIAAHGNRELDVVVGENKAVADNVVWSCVACRACEQACPVTIEFVDKMVDLRQHLVQEASRFPAELHRAFKGMETNSNPWGISLEDRAAWADGFDVPRISEKPDAEYIYYVGCGGSFDPNNKKATQSFVKILKSARVSFAILGKGEGCNGETARRLGNEYLFQTMAEQLANTIKAAGVKKILVNCPHCFNTLKNEYPDFGGKWEVIHAAAFVGKLAAEGKIKIDGEFAKRIVYHDSCYYGRFNDIYDEPRNLITKLPGCKLLEMDRCKHNGMCCGAGGGRMWMEEAKDQRVNIFRTEQALAKNPEVIATSCPFCKIMIGSAINEKALSDKVAVMDVMEMVAAHVSEWK